MTEERGEPREGGAITANKYTQMSHTPTHRLLTLLASTICLILSCHACMARVLTALFCSWQTESLTPLG